MPRISLKRLVALCFACLLCCASALAEPRYPEKTGDATDAAPAPLRPDPFGLGAAGRKREG